MTLLAIDSSTQASGLALYDGLQVLAEHSWQGRAYHSVDLAPAIQDMLGAAGLAPAELKVVAVAIGPGSYTGLRIGLAIAKGLAFVHKLDLLAVPTLDILAAGQPRSELPLAAVLQAGRGRLAVGRYIYKEAWEADGPPELMTAEALTESISRPTLVSGELSEDDRRTLGRKYKNVVLASPAWAQRRPAVLAELAWGRWGAGERTPAQGLAPQYLQASEAVPQ
ncbi:MAG: tRNA (adenosine(37)-N6)-threonylcarbamoyltransferase complex dimerization subunit type 1 TsaB [Anaerolineales bacterium]|nr:tRNA (adenosine(37)-N6)-threonylcarbamoyltransferase complex dimerization subunit type 1 TsaB [Anaerolineales bacterium]